LSVAWALAAVPERATSLSSWLMMKALRGSITCGISASAGGLVSCSTRPRWSSMRLMKRGAA